MRHVTEYFISLLNMLELCRRVSTCLIASELLFCHEVTTSAILRLCHKVEFQGVVLCMSATTVCHDRCHSAAVTCVDTPVPLNLKIVQLLHDQCKGLERNAGKLVVQILPFPYKIQHGVLDLVGFVQLTLNVFEHCSWFMNVAWLPGSPLPYA